ncbi:MAG: sodium-independent anion transporter, partial [Gammaproteobacteria bacterium]|nr:sodium-independent anion transporter [Gammaproteobacteria bacterium]
VHTDLPVDEKVVAVRFDGSLYFANVSYFEEAILAAAANHQEAKFILVVGDGINLLDASGEEVLHHLVQRLHDNGVTLVFSGLKRQILKVMIKTNLIELIGKQNIHATADQALEAIYQQLDAAADGEVYCPLRPGFKAENYKRIES